MGILSSFYLGFNKATAGHYSHLYYKFEGLEGCITTHGIFFLLIPVDTYIRIVIGVVTSLVLIIGILIIVIVVLSMVIIKGRKPHHRCTCQGLFSAKFVVCIGFSMTLYIFIAIDKDIETKPNDVYGLIDGKLYGIYYSGSCHFNSL